MTLSFYAVTGAPVLAHIVHIGADVAELNAWYRDAFDVQGFMGWPAPHYLESERRWASMFMVDDLCVETMAPDVPVDASTAVGRSFLRRGSHLSSIAYRVDDLPAVGRRLLDAGVFIGAPGGGAASEIGAGVRYIVPSPRDLAGVRLEFLDVVLAGDPRSQPGWADRSRPLGLLGVSHLTLAVPDPRAARDRIIDLLGAEPASARSVRFGDSVLDFVGCLTGDPGLAQVTFRASDLELIEDRLQGTRVAAGLEVEAFGAKYAFTSDPGDTV